MEETSINKVDLHRINSLKIQLSQRIAVLSDESATEVFGLNVTRPGQRLDHLHNMTAATL